MNLLTQFSQKNAKAVAGSPLILNLHGCKFFMAACTLTVGVSCAGVAHAEKPKNNLPVAPTVQVSQDGKSLVVKRSESTPIHVPVLERCGHPVVGEPHIRHINLEHGNIIATYGKHCTATLSLETLVLKCTGCD